MAAAGLFIDANLLVLLVVGSVGRDLIAKHRRLREYTEEDYETLVDVLSRVDRVLVTPNTLTETSNLLAQHAEPERSRFFDRLRVLIQETEEVVVASTQASNNSEFRRLGLTDAALLEVATEETPLVTVDLDLYLAVLAKGEDAAVNFRHLQGL
ncbi:MAG: hypothetical protein J4F43_06280 [Dehalococcoidia bacterium]|nr:hypothetical protein [Dehalococcoidia bacterium]